MDKHFLTLVATPSGPIRTEVLMGQSFRVVPAVLVRSQVLTNNLGDTYLPADEINTGWAQSWNAIPVIAGDHPMVQGQAVSARDPQILNTRGVGYIFAAQTDVEGDATRLKGEVWLNESRRTAVPELHAILQRLDAGKSVELSTGFPTVLEETVGVHNGRSYSRILRPQGADHLAVFTQATGACSCEDGCGLGVNHRPGACTCGGTCGCGGGTASTEGVATMTQAAATVVPDDPKKGFLARIGTAVCRALGIKDVDIKEVDLQAFVENITNPSDEERRQLVGAAIKAKVASPGGTPPRDPIVVAIYADNGQAVFFWSGMGCDCPSWPQGDEYLRVGFSMNASGQVTIDGEPELVRRRTVFEPVSVAGNKGTGDPPAPDSQQEDVTMARAQIIAALVAAGTLDAVTLEKLSDAQLTALQTAGGGTGGGVAGGGGGESAAAAPSAASAGTAEVTAALGQVTAALTALRADVDGIKSGMAAFDVVTKPALEERERERGELVQTLSGNTRVAAVHSKAELEAMSLESLRKVYSLSAGQSYRAKGGPQAAHNVSAPEFAEPVPYHVQPKKEATV